MTCRFQKRWLPPRLVPTMHSTIIKSVLGWMNADKASSNSSSFLCLHCVASTFCSIDKTPQLATFLAEQLPGQQCVGCNHPHRHKHVLWGVFDPKMWNTCLLHAIPAWLLSSHVYGWYKDAHLCCLYPDILTIIFWVFFQFVSDCFSHSFT